MAFLKDKTLADGTTGNYWKVTGVLMDRVSGGVRAELCLFLSQAAAQSGARPMAMKKHFTFRATPQELLGNVTALAYTKIKENIETVLTKDLRGNEVPPFPAEPDLYGAVDA